MTCVDDERLTLEVSSQCFVPALLSHDNINNLCEALVSNASATLSDSEKLGGGGGGVAGLLTVVYVLLLLS